MAMSAQLQRAVASNGTVIVAINALYPKGFFGELTFWYYAIPSKIQADNASGALYVDVATKNGAHYSFTVWESRQAMRAYVSSGSHLEAMKNFRRFATGKVYSYETSAVPSIDEAIAMLEANGRAFG